jgi:o-succinylbenzoate synthase
MYTYEILPYRLIFSFPAKTSRSSLSHKTSWILKLKDGNRIGYGEIAPLEGLSPEFVPDFEALIHAKLNELLKSGEDYHDFLKDFPSIRFGWETAILDLNSNSRQLLFPSTFSEGKNGILINGLIWMGTAEYMKQQVRQKIEKGFTCLKLKVGAIQLDDEFELLQMIRNEFSAQDLSIRLDANGAFPASEALHLLDRFSAFEIHSIEQPIKAGQIDEMAKICANSPIPIALDEELIGLNDIKQKSELLNQVNPQYIILKPSLLGGTVAANEWIQLAEDKGIGWWNTSALESNIGLNAISQWTASLSPILPQGLGTGQLYVNNISSPLTVNGEFLYYLPELKWQMPF